MNSIRLPAPTKLLWSVLGVYFFILLLFGLDRHWSMKTSIYDTGVFDQAIWSCLQGELLLDTVIFSKPISWLGFHFHPILLLFVPLYALAPAPEWLIIGQALAITLAAIPIYQVAIVLNFSESMAWIWTLGFLLNPFVLSAALWDFHPVALATPLLAFSVLYLHTGRFGRLLGCLGLLLLCQEQYGLVLVCVAASYYLIHRDAKAALTIALLGLTYTLFLFGYVFPALSPTQGHVMMTGTPGSSDRYSWLGNTLPAIAINFLTHPWNILKFCLLDMEGYKYLLFLLIPLGSILPLFGLEILIVATVDFAANFLSLNPLPRLVISYHSVTLIPIVLIAAMVGFNRLKKRHTTWQAQRILGWWVASFVAVWIFLSPLLFGKNSFWLLRPIPVQDRTLATVHSLVPSEASLSVQSNVGSHFSQRRQLYAFPNRVGQADFIVLKLEDGDNTLQHDRLRFVHHMSMPPEQYLSSIHCLLVARQYDVNFFDPPWLVLRRRHSAAVYSVPENLEQYLAYLASQWRLDRSFAVSIQCSGET